MPPPPALAIVADDDDDAGEEARLLLFWSVLAYLWIVPGCTHSIRSYTKDASYCSLAV